MCIRDRLNEYLAANKGKSMPIATIHPIYTKLSNGCTSRRERDFYLLRTLKRYPREFSVTGDPPFMQIHSPYSNLELTEPDIAVTSPPSQSSAREDPAAAQDPPEPRFTGDMVVTSARDERQSHSLSSEVTCTSRTLSSSVDAPSNVESSWQRVERPEDSM